MLRRTTLVLGGLSGGAEDGQCLLMAATSGLNVSIAEELAIAREPFARMAATQDTREAVDACLAARGSRSASSARMVRAAGVEPAQLSRAEGF